MKLGEDLPTDHPTSPLPIFAPLKSGETSDKFLQDRVELVFSS